MTSTHYRPTLSEGDRLVLAARFEEYLTWRHAGAPAPRSAAETAKRIGWQSHTVAKRCENIRNRYTRVGVPGLRGPRALEELVRLLRSTGTLTAAGCCGGARRASSFTGARHLGWLREDSPGRAFAPGLRRPQEVSADAG